MGGFYYVGSCTKDKLKIDIYRNPLDTSMVTDELLSICTSIFACIYAVP